MTRDTLRCTHGEVECDAVRGVIRCRKCGTSAALAASSEAPDGTWQNDWRGFLIAHARDLHGCEHDFGGDVRDDPQREAEGLDVEDWAAIESCLAACALDPREPERYRDWYAAVLGKVRSRLTPKEPTASREPTDG
jgi:hypothetical protein